MFCLPGEGIDFSWVAVIMMWRYSISFLKTSMNSTMPRFPALNAPFRLRTLGSSSGYLSSFEMSSDPIRTDVSWLFGSTGGTTPIPRRALLENSIVTTGKFSYWLLKSSRRR